MLQTSVTAENVFLKRKRIKCRVNPYKRLIGCFESNHDIQYVLDAYVVLCISCLISTKVAKV